MADKITIKLSRRTSLSERPELPIEDALARTTRQIQLGQIRATKRWTAILRLLERIDKMTQ